MPRPSLLSVHDLPAAFGLLTRLPVPVDGPRAMARGATAAWAYPLVGALVAALAGAVFLVSTTVGLPTMLAAGLSLLALVALTGALHEDGLADTADGLWGGWTRERRLEIMKDSRIGAYGVLALGFSVALRWGALGALDSAAQVGAALVAAAALSRGAMVAVWAVLPPARPTGLAAQVGQPPRATAMLATVTALGIAALAIGPLPTLAAGAAVMGTTAGLARLALRRIGGQTGDILGATQQVSEIVTLLVLCILAG